MIIKSDYRIASTIDGVGMLLRNKHLTDAEHRLPNNTVLFVHGATYGSTATFDYPIDGESWMDHMAMAGFDVWCLDLPGYGLSDRPTEMQQPADANEPLIDTACAVSELARAVDFLLKDREIKQLSLIGYSWGTTIVSRYSASYPDNVSRLVLSGALWVEKGDQPGSVTPEFGAYRTVAPEAIEKRWSIGLSDAELDSIVPRQTVRQWCADMVALDPDSDSSGVLRAPTGVLKDFHHFSTTGELWYDPAEIQCPTQIVVGDLDRETTPQQGRQVFDRLSPDIDRRYTVLGGGTHSMLLENQRFGLFSVVEGFLR